MRALNPIEHSFVSINNFYPFVASCVLRISDGPGIEQLRSALNRLQKLHPLLNVVIRERNKGLWFEKDEDLEPVPLNVISRKDDVHWEDIVRHDLNNGFTAKGCPLMRVNYLISSGGPGNAELVISFHHAIVDARLIMFMTDQLLSFASQNAYKDDQSFDVIPYLPAPDLSKVLPRSFRGIRFIFRLLPFMYRQLKDESIYKKTNKGIADARIPASSENDIVMLSFSKSETDAIKRWSRRKRISINGMLSAAMLIIINQRNYEGRKKLLRALQFGNLRPYLHPSIHDSEGGSFVSMMRYTIPLHPDSGMSRTASLIDKQSLRSSRRGEKFIFALISKFLIKKTIKDHNSRLGATALSYLGPVSIKKQYGKIEVQEIHGYISNNCLGAELTGFAKIFSGQLSMDLNFLRAELSRDKALEAADELKGLILRSIAYES